MTLLNLLTALRLRLINAIEADDRESLRFLCTTFGVLREASYSIGNRPLTIVLEDLEYSAQHGAMGELAKAKDIPSVDSISAALDLQG